MLSHPLKEEFKKGARSEIQSLVSMQTFELIKCKLENIQVLPLRWVFAYKFRDDGFLDKVKFRLIVRGDLQCTPSVQDTKAMTLAARTFRVLMSITAAFDMDAIQLDVKNSVLKAELRENGSVYLSYPEGFTCGWAPQGIMKLKRALYGLRCSPFLWQQEFVKRLRSMGFEQLTEDKCVLTDRKVILFFYVDDIVLIARPEDRYALDHRRSQLKSFYVMRDLGNMAWFLNIRIVRNRSKRLL